jgi:protein O-mannosyl-transferase
MEKKVKQVNIVQPKVNARYPILNTRYQILIIGLLVVLLYGNTLFNKFALDDTLIITQNKFTKMGIKGIGKIVSNDAFVGFFGENKNLLPGGRYRPLSQVIFAIEYQFAGLNPFLGHLVNLLTYAALCILIFIILSSLFKSSPIQNSKFKIQNSLFSIPFIAALLFVAHPLHTEAVANIKGLDEVLGMLLAMSSLYFVLRYVDRDFKIYRFTNLPISKFLNLFIIAFTFLLALLTKENTITFLAVIPLTLYVFRKIPLREHFIVSCVLCLAVAVYFVIRYEALGFVFGNMATEKELLNNPFLYSTVSEKYATIMMTLGKYLQLLFLPYNITHDYYPKQLPIVNWGDLRAIIPFLIFGFLTVYSLINIFRRSNLPAARQLTNSPTHQLTASQTVSYGILFFLITFSIQSNIIFNIGTFMNERFVFISVLGFSLIAAHFISLKTSHLKLKTSILLIVLLGFSFKTFTRNFVWKDDYTLFTTDVSTSSNSAKCNVSAGGMYYEKAKIEKDSLQKQQLLRTSLDYLLKGVDIHPNYVQGWMLVGNVYLEMKDYAQARISYENILKISKTHPDALNNLLFVAQATDKKNLVRESVESFRTLLRYKPGDPDYLYQFASALAKSGRVDTAIVILNNLITIKPDYYNAYNKFGEIYGRYLNDMNRSLIYLNKALSLKSNDASVLENLGVAYGIIKQFDKSEYYFKKALEVKPDNPQVYQNLAGTYKNMGRIDLAEIAMAKAQELEKKNKN